MGIDKELIKMCDCPEIQNRRTVCPLITDKEEVAHISCSPAGDFAYSSKEKFLWIPIQGQLQDMIEWYKDSDMSGNQRIRELLDMVRFFDTMDDNKFDSFEKLWLAFVMDKLYNKTWDGETWK